MRMPFAGKVSIRIPAWLRRSRRAEHVYSGKDFCQREERYRSLVEMSPETIFIYRGNAVVYMNPAGIRLFGAADPGQILGKSMFALFHPDYHARTRQRINLLMHGKAVSLIQSRIVRLDGTAVDVEVVSSPFMDQGVRAIQVMLRDITERRQAETVLKRDKETFEKLIRDRTDELIGVQLELEKAKRLSDIGTIATTVAHELRNPLAAIELAAANISRKNDDKRLTGHLATIHKKVGESDQIINNLLFYSRLKTPHFSPINICEALMESVTVCKARFTGKAISFNLRVDAVKRAMVNADHFQIKEVFLNILNNAVDAIPSAVKGTIEISGSVTNNKIVIAFRDNGIGMTEEVRKQAFEPFFTTKSKGTGLGLTVSAQIVKFHHGSIRIEPVEGAGALVSVSLPENAGFCVPMEGYRAGSEEG